MALRLGGIRRRFGGSSFRCRRLDLLLSCMNRPEYFWHQQGAYSKVAIATPWLNLIDEMIGQRAVDVDVGSANKSWCQPPLLVLRNP